MKQGKEQNLAGKVHSLHMNHPGVHPTVARLIDSVIVIAIGTVLEIVLVLVLALVLVLVAFVLCLHLVRCAVPYDLDTHCW